MKRIVKWFEMNWGWIFINPNHRDRYAAYLRKKYDKCTLPPTRRKMETL